MELILLCRVFALVRRNGLVEPHAVHIKRNPLLCDDYWARPTYAATMRTGDDLERRVGVRYSDL
jgi:cbb3-type cytochrome oxidase cytochrome c subunit